MGKAFRTRVGEGGRWKARETEDTVQHREEGKKGLTEKNTERNTSVGQSMSLGLSDFGSDCMKNEKKKREKDLFDVLR